MALDQAVELRQRDPRGYQARSMEAMVAHCRAMVAMQERGAVVFDYGNNLRQQAFNAGYAGVKVGGDPEGEWVYPGFVPAYIRPLFCEGQGPFRWVALSGDPQDIYATDEILIDLFPEKTHLVRWIRMAQEQVVFQGLPSRICWLGYGERDKAGLAFNEAVASGRVSAPIVIGRDHLDCGSVASPNRETVSPEDTSSLITSTSTPSSPSLAAAFLALSSACLQRRQGGFTPMTSTFNFLIAHHGEKAMNN